MVAVEVENPKQIIRTSDRGTFKRCRVQWDFQSKMRMNMQYAPGVEPLDFGTAVHRALEEYYNPAMWDGAIEVREALTLLWFNNSMLEWKGRIVAADLWDNQKDRYNELIELGEGMLKHYFLWAPEADKHYRPVKCEIEFEVPIPYTEDSPNDWYFSADMEGNMTYHGQRVVYQGRIDVIFQDLRDGSLWIVDHKTAAQFGQTEHLELDQQCGSYVWACKKQLGLDIQGVIYSELRKKVPKDPDLLKNGMPSRNKAQSTTSELYKKKLRELNLEVGPYQDFLQSLQDDGQQYFRRIAIHRSDSELAALEANIVNEAIDMIDNPRIYPNPSRWNCNGCQFRSPCIMRQEGSDWEWFVKSSKMYMTRG